MKRSSLINMPLDGFIQYAIDTGVIKITKNLNVYDSRLKRNLKLTQRRQGSYCLVRINVNGVSRQAKLHRILLINAIGSKELLDKHVAHLDGNPENNNLDNLKPMTPRDHLYYDGNATKLTWEPCKICGTMGGNYYGKHKTPERINGMCRNCYYKKYKRR